MMVGSGAKRLQLSCWSPGGPSGLPALERYYNGVIGVEMPEGVPLVRHADDLKVVAVTKTGSQLHNNINTALINVKDWFRFQHLEVAPEKAPAIEIAQINLDRKKISDDLLRNISIRDNIDICIISEPNKKIARKKNYLVDIRCDAAIIVTNKNIITTGHGRGDGFVWAEFENVIIYSCYISPNVGRDEYERVLLNLGEEVRRHRKPAVVASDFNAKSAIGDRPRTTSGETFWQNGSKN